MSERASHQYGLITRAQAREYGMSPGQISWAAVSGAWVTVHPGVYRLAGSPRSAESDLLAAWPVAVHRRPTSRPRGSGA